MKREIICVSLFNGMGGAFMALEMSGFDVVQKISSEIDKYAIKANDTLFDDTIQMGDVSKIVVVKEEGRVVGLKNDKGLEVRFKEGVEIMVCGGSPCFVKGTTILTEGMIKNIEDIKVGDMVLTHQNRYKKVLKIGGNKNSEIYTVKASGLPLIETTSEHPFYVKSVSKKRNWDKENGTSTRMFDEPIWKETKDLQKGDFLAIPILKTETNPLNITKEEAFIIGRYIADGHTRKDYRNSENRPNDRHWQLILSVGHQKLDQFADKVKQKHSNYKHTQSTNRIVFSSKRLVEIVEEHCGCGAKNKFISKTLLDLPNDLLSELFEGYLSGDGCKVGEFYSMSTISERLAQNIILVVAKLYKVGVQYSFVKVKPTTVIQGRTVNQSDAYLIKFSKEPKKQSKFISDENFVWVPLKAVTKTDYKQDVYNLEVEDDNSYIASNCVVHNCQSFSFSGKRKGMATKDEQEILTLDHYLRLKSEDYEFEGQSYLFWEFVRLRDEIKPNYWFLENVEMGEKWEKVLSKAVGVNGVHINSALLSAQNRKRIYWLNFGMEPMGLFGELGSIVTQPKDKGILLKDVLESDVDEKYYLSDKMLNFLNKREKQTSDLNSKSGCFTAGGNSGGLHSQMDLIVHNTLPRSSKTGKGGTGPLSRNDGKIYCLDTGCTNAIEIRETLLSGLKSKDKRLKKLITDTDFEGIEVAHLDTYNQAIDTEKSCALKLPHNDRFLYEKKVIQLNDSKESGGKKPYQQNRVYDVNGISPALCAFKSDLLIANDVKCVAMRGRNQEDENGEKLPTEQMLEPRDDNKTNCLTTVSKDNLVMENQVYGADYRSDEGIRIRENGKAPTLTSGSKNSGTQLNSLAITHSSIRRLTPKEAMRLQTVPEHYIDMLLKAGISESQLYRMTGNGWTIEVISYLFNYIK